MSGHSKWSTIKRQKGVKDQKRGQIFTKLSYAISTAIREGGGVSDPASNYRLRLAIDDAKSANMPKENINRAIDRATGKSEEEIQEILFEGYGPLGISIIVETLTDNRQRTVSEVKNVFDKNGGNLGVSGSVLYQFDKKGIIVLDKGSKSLEDIFLIAAGFDAEDVEDNETDVIIYTKSENFATVRDKLANSQLIIKQAHLTWVPINYINISRLEDAKRVLKFINIIESLDDVQAVYANIKIDRE